MHTTIIIAITWAMVEPVEFVSYEATLERFQQEWLEIVKQLQRKKP